jgi:hypothetical protein
MVSDISRGACCKGCGRLLLRSTVSWAKRHDIGLYEGDLSELLWLDVICTCGRVTSVCAVAQPIGYIHTLGDKWFLSAPTARQTKVKRANTAQTSAP